MNLRILDLTFTKVRLYPHKLIFIYGTAFLLVESKGFHKKKVLLFLSTELGQPKEKRNQTKFNKTYTIFSWPVGLTAAIAGSQNIQFSTSIRVRVKSRGNSPFNSPFFNDPFFGFGREESITVQSALQTLEIRKLPMNERPDSFRGAIGNFTVRTIPDTDRVSLGDPVGLL